MIIEPGLETIDLQVFILICSGLLILGLTIYTIIGFIYTIIKRD
jgi:hypothetical protein